MPRVRPHDGRCDDWSESSRPNSGDYNVTRRTDVYAGFMYSKFKGAAFIRSESSNYIVATGIRTMF